MRVLRLLLVLFICAVPAAADTIYQVNGTMSITGNPVCNGLPCVETVNFSLLFEVLPFDPSVPNLFLLQLDRVVSLESIGPLAPFNRVGIITTGLGFGNTTFDEIDIDAIVGPTESRVFPVLADAFLYGCGQGIHDASPACAADFGTDLGGGGDPFICCIVRGGTLTYTVETVSTPEGSTRLYLLVGVGLGLLGMLARTQKRPHP